MGLIESAGQGRELQPSSAGGSVAGASVAGGASVPGGVGESDESFVTTMKMTTAITTTTNSPMIAPIAEPLDVLPPPTGCAAAGDAGIDTCVPGTGGARA